MSKIYEKICINCGETFKTHGHSALRCVECRQQLERQKQRDRYLIKKAKGHRLRPAKSINQILRELEAYNKEHKTHLTYGQYMLKVEGGQADEK